MKEITDLRYPVGNFEYGKNYSIEETRKHIKTIARLPKDLKKQVKKLRDGALDKSYRPGGWTARQVIHHLADSHMNAYTRCKLAATEKTPIIKPYEENLWAQTEDSKHGPVKTSLKLLAALHTRWVDFLSTLSDEDLDLGYYHPANKRTVSLREAIALYAWHSRHHLAHVKIVASGKGVIPEKAGKKKAAKAAKTEAKDTAPKKRTLSQEHRAKIAAAQQARRAAEKAAKAPTANTPPARKKPGPKPKAVAVPKAAPEKPKRTRRSSAEVAAEKAAKAAMPKLSRAEVMAKARAAAAANRAAAGKVAKPKSAPGKPRRPRRSSAEVAAEKAAKAAMPKLSRAEVMAKARAAAAANRAAAGKVAKPKKASDAPKLSRAEVLSKARAARQAKKK